MNIKKFREFYRQQFAAAENTNVTTDFEPALSVDYTTRLGSSVKKLQEILGVTEMIPMQAGSAVKLYKTTVTKPSTQVAEGDVIGLSKVKRAVASTLEMPAGKYLRRTTLEAIQKVGRDIALNKADNSLIGEIRKDVKAGFFTSLAAGKGTALAGSNLQQAAANAWGAVQAYYEDQDVQPLFAFNPMDVATYLGNAAITTQTTFGFSYIEDFLGMGTAILSAKVPAGTVIATVKENVNGAYIPASGDVAGAFGLTYDETGMIGMTHAINAERASIETLIIASVLFFVEDITGVFTAKISQG